jgi:hypothetical protein
MIEEMNPTKFRITHNTEEEIVSEGSVERQLRLLQVMELLNAKEVFATPQKSKEFLESLDFEGLKKYLELVNRILRNLDSGKKQEMGESNSYIYTSGTVEGDIINYRPPEKKYRKELLKLAFRKAQTANTPEKAGLTLALAVNTIHPFDDANGRTGRLLYSLSVHGYDGSEADKKLFSEILENQKGRELVNPNPEKVGLDLFLLNNIAISVAREKGWKQIPQYIFAPYASDANYEASNLVLGEGTGVLDRNTLHHVLSDEKFSVVSAIKTFNFDRVKDYIEEVKADGNLVKSDWCFMRGENFIKTLSKDEIKNWYYSHSALKVEYVEQVVSFSERPDADAIVQVYQDKSKILRKSSKTDF